MGPPCSPCVLQNISPLFKFYSLIISTYITKKMHLHLAETQRNFQGNFQVVFDKKLVYFRK